MKHFYDRLSTKPSSYTVYRDMLVEPIFNEAASLNNAGRISYIFGPRYEIYLFIFIYSLFSVDIQLIKTVMIKIAL